MGKIDYKAIYDRNKNGWRDLTDDPQKYEALLAGHYSDSNHFIYELLQNAEDAFETNSDGVFDPATCAHASKVLIEFYHDKLIFYHNGKPFDEADVKGVSSMLMGTKDKDSGQTIGRFGMGFKSVFKYTNQPSIYSDEEAFKIKNYLLPVEIENGWDFEKVKQNLSCKLSRNRSINPFFNDKHLTRIVIPFLKYGKDDSLCSVSGAEVLEKLKELNGEILLFLTHIKELFWINRDSGSFAHITKTIDDEDNHLITCRMEGSAFGDRVDIAYYYLFKKVFDHKEMDNAEVSVAYKLNQRADNINETAKSPIWVYFPTRDETDLPFIIHGSFETAVSREKLMVPSSFNDDLFDELGTLIAESMEVLAQKKLITQMFIRKILLAAFDDEIENKTIIGLKDKVTDVFKENALLPCKVGEYRQPSELLVPVPFQIADFSYKRLIGKAITNKHFVAINSEKETNFPAYFLWLTEDLEIPIYKLSDLAGDLEVIGAYKIPLTGALLEELKEFYKFLMEFRESIYDTGLSYSRSGVYETAIKNDVGLAWMKLRNAPVILNGINQLSAAYVDGKPKVYLGSTSDYKKLLQSSLVHNNIAHSYSTLLKDGFKIPEYDNFQYVKENVIQKYLGDESTIEFADNDNYEDEYAEDIKQILGLIDNSGNTDEIIKMLENASVIKVKPDSPEDDFGTFDLPKNCYVPESDEGVSLNVLLAPIPYKNVDEKGFSDPNNWYNFDLSPIDVDFYDKNGISISKLSKLGIVTSLIEEGARSNTNDRGYYYWVAQGEYCPNIEVIGLEDNLNFIKHYSMNEKAKEKSSELLKLLIKISNKLKGKIKRKKTNPYEDEGEAALLSVIRKKAWLYDQDMNLCSPNKMSRYDLNRELYDVDLSNRKAFEILGFIEKKIDGTEETLQKAQSLDEQGKRRLLDYLAKDLGMHVLSVSEDEDWDDVDSSDVFNPNEYIDNEFPVRRVVNMDYLVRHVQEQFYLADTVKYEKVLRQIRTSKNSKIDNAYAQGMYTNSSNVTICQSCKKPTLTPRVNQISNYGIEMPQLNLCFCPDCSAIFKTVCDKNKNEFKKRMQKELLSVDIRTNSYEYCIAVNNSMNIHFTQTHLAEIQVILKLLSEYGLPANHDDGETPATIIVSSSNADLERIKNESLFMQEALSVDVIKPSVEEKPIKDNKIIDLDIGWVPEELREDADEYEIVGDLNGSYYIVPFSGKLKQITSRPTQQMFFEMHKDGKRNPVHLLTMVDVEHRVIFVPWVKYKEFQAEFATTTLKIKRQIN